MNSKNRSVTFQGNPLTLTGKGDFSVGSKAPDFTVNKGMAEMLSLKDLAGKTILLTSVPSLDTPVCDIQAKKFNEQAAALGDNVAVVLVSRDLPFAQARWCGANSAENVIVTSDYKTGEFGENYGLIIQEMALLARAVIIIDKDGTVQYEEVVGEISKEPNYEAALTALKSLS